MVASGGGQVEKKGSWKKASSAYMKEPHTTDRVVVLKHTTHEKCSASQYGAKRIRAEAAILNWSHESRGNELMLLVVSPACAQATFNIEQMMI